MDSRANATELLNAKLLNAINDSKIDDIKRLIADGADLVAKHENMTPMQYASSKELWHCVRAIAEAKNTDAEDSYGYATALQAAAKENYVGIVYALLRAGAPIHIKSQSYKDNGTIMHWAVMTREKWLIDYLIAHGADLSAQDADHRTPMTLAKVNKTWNVVEWIAKAKHADASNTDGYQGALLMAVVYNQESAVRCLLEAGTKTDCIYSDTKDTLLHEAVKKSRHGIIKMLIEHGADLAAVDANQQTPMQLAVRLEKWQVVECIARNAKTTPLDRFGFNDALLAVAKTERKGTVDLLLASGTPATGKVDGDTLLHRALARNDKTLILKLIKNGVNLSAVDSSNRTAMDYAVYFRQWEFVKLIACNKSNDDLDAYHYGNALVSAVRANEKPAVEALLHANALNNSKNNAAVRAVLHDAMDYSTADVVRHLVVHNADLAVLDLYSRTPIQHAAATLGYWTSVEVIAKARQANANDTYRYGSVLEKAVYNGRYDTAKCLLEAKASLGWKRRDGNGILHRAVMKADARMLELLLKHGADLSAKNSDGKTPMELAVELIRPKCASVMIERKTDQNDTHHYGQALLYAMQNGCSRDEVKALIAAGACNLKTNAERLFLHAVASGKLENAKDILAAAPNVIAAKEKGDGVLHLAVKNNNLDMLRFLLESGALQTCQNRARHTPIELAAELGNWKSVQLLLEFDHQNGHNKQLLEDLHFEQALLIAIQKSHYAAAKLLLEHHAPCDRWTIELGNVALYWAVKNNERNPEMVTLLLEHGADASLRNKDGKTIEEVARDMRHPACAARLHAHPCMVKPGKTAREYRQDANKYYEQLSQNATRLEGIPEVIRDMQACYRALLQCDLDVLMQRRDVLKQKHADTQKEKSALDLLNFEPSAIDNEMENINSLIMVINTLLNYPDKTPSPTFLHKHPSQEDNDVSDYLNRKSLTDDYLRRVRVYLQQLNSEIRDYDWKVKTFLGTWVKGIPTHTKAICKELDKLPAANKQDEIYAIFAAIVNLLNGIDTLERRHESTSYFYHYQKRGLSAMSFVALSSSPLQEEQASADRQMMLPSAVTVSTISESTYPRMYPKIDEDQIMAASPVIQSRLSPVMTPLPVHYPTVEAASTVTLVQQPAPSAPDPDSVDVECPDVPTKLIRQVSNSSLYQQRAKKSDAKDVHAEKKPGGRVALFG